MSVLDPPPMFSGTMFVLDASGQIVRGWGAPRTSCDVFAALDVDDGRPEAALIQLALASTVGAPASAWSVLAADLPTVLVCRSGAPLVLHWQPVDRGGVVIGVTMFVLPIGDGSQIEPDDPAERNRLCVDALGLVDECDACLRHLRSDPAARHAVHRMFRAVHTIKGSTRGTQLRSISDLAHHVEETLDVLRRREEPADRDALMQVETDLRRLRAAIGSARPRAEVDDAITVLSAELRSAIVDLRAAAARLAADEPDARSAAKRAIHQVIDGAQQAHLRALHDVCEKLRSAASADQLLELAGLVELYISVHREASSSETGPSTLISLASCIDTEDVESIIALMSEAGTQSLVDSLREHGMARAFAVLADAAAMFEPARQRDDATLRFERAQRELLAFLDGLDELPPAKLAAARRIANRLVWTPLSLISRRLARMTRSLGAELGKHVEADIDLGNLLVAPEIGRVIGEILVHAVRNAIDHGIEAQSDRVERGKEAVGKITVRGSSDGDRVRIVVRDDGRGIATDRVCAVAIAHSLVGEEVAATLPPDEILEFLFVPGFSTATSVTTVSGRGVGMDVIKTLAEAHGGTIRLSTEAGKGTQLTLDLPVAPA